ncbi:20426_t:CDS:1, partial [Cetraspora pellucida]
LKIDTIFKTTTSNLKHKQNQTRSLVEWIINSAQPLYILESQKFKAFIATLDPYYELPTRKAVKSMIHNAYNFSFNVLKQKLKDTATSCSLICNLWTSRNRESYLGITCYWIDQDFKLNEVLLAIILCSYPHTAENIYNTLFVTMDYWDILHK